jgi:hypothetical protein
VTGRIRSVEKCNDIGNRTPPPDFPACSVVPQPTTLPRAPDVDDNDYVIFQTKNDIRGKLCISGEREILRKVNGSGACRIRTKQNQNLVVTL